MFKELRKLDKLFDNKEITKEEYDSLYKKATKNKPFGIIWVDTKHPEFFQTYYLWEVQNKNRNSLIRIYDKVLDTWKKKKGFLASSDRCETFKNG